MNNNRIPAHLFIISKLNKNGIPEFHDIRILSDENPTTMGNEVYSKVCEIRGNSFHEAHENMVRYLRDQPHMQWAHNLMTSESRLQRMRQQSDNVCVSCGFSKNDTTVTSVLTITVPR